MTTRNPVRVFAIAFAVLMVTSVATVGGQAPPDKATAGAEMTDVEDYHAQVVESKTAITDSNGLSISGSISYADGSPVDGWKVIAGGDDGNVSSTFTTNGNYSVPVEPNTTYKLYYQQYNGNHSQSWVRDGRPDIHAIDVVSVGTTNATATDRQFPRAYVLNVTVRDQAGNPVQDADIHVEQRTGHGEAQGEARTNLDGMAHWRAHSDQPGLELRGEVQIWVDGPPGLGTNFTELTVSSNRSITLTLPNTVNVTGHVSHTDGRVAEHNQVFFDGVEEAGTNDWTGTRTDAVGNFSTELNEEGTYDIGYQQWDPDNDSDTAWPTDGAPDIYSFGRLSVGTTDLDLGNLSLPNAHRLNVTVVDETGAPIENADVNIGSFNGSARVWTQAPSNANGRLEHPNGDDVGIEVIGEVGVHVEPPAASNYSDNGTDIVVNEDRELTIVLHSTVRATGQINESDGTPAAADEIQWAGIEGTRDFEENVTDAQGRYSVQIQANGTFEVGYRQNDPTSTADLAFPRDGSPDIFTIGAFESDGPLQVSTTLPTAHLLNVTVVRPDGTPIEGVGVRVEHILEQDDLHLETGLSADTNSHGAVEHPESDGPGFEVVGSVGIEVHAPPDSPFADQRVSLTVTNRTNVTVVLRRAVNVSGQYFEADGDPAATDQLNYHEINDEHFQDNLTDEHGRVSTRLLENSTYEVGYEQNPEWTDNAVAYPKDGTVDIQALGFVDVGTSDLTSIGERLPKGHNLTVTVVNESGAPVEDARVNVVSHEEEPDVSEAAHAHVAAPTNATGDLVHPESNGPGFEVNGTVHVHADPPEGSELGGEGETIDVTSDRHITLTLQEEVPIRGRIEYSDGSAAANTTVHFHGRNGTRDGRQNITDLEGRFETAAHANATYNIHYHQANFRDDSAERFPKDGNPDIYGFTQVSTGTNGTEVGNLTLPAAHLVHLKVVNESGAPVPDATVRVFHNPPHGIEGGPDANLLPDGAPTNENGLLEVPNGDGPGLELVGDIEVRVLPPSGSQLIGNRTQFTVSNDTNVTVQLDRGVPVTGEIRQFDGTPASDDRIKYHTIPDGSPPPDVVQVTETNGSGHYELFVEPNRTYNIQYHQEPATRDGYVDVFAFPQVDVGPAGFEAGQQTLPPGHVLNVSVVDANGTPVDDARVVINHHNGEAWATESLPTDEAGAMYDPETGLRGIELNGSANVRVEPPLGTDLATNRTDIEIHSDQHLTVVLKEKVELRGQFIEADGDPAAQDNVAVFAEEPLGGGSKILTTNAAGNFSTFVGQDTTHDVQYYQADFTSDWGPGDFARDGSPDMVAVARVNTSDGPEVIDLGSIQFKQAHTLNVSVVDPAGGPVERARVSVTHFNADDPSDAALVRIGTNEDGLMHLNLTDNTTIDPPPGMELYGKVRVRVSPPPNSSYLDRTYERTVNVSNETLLTFQLEKPVTVTGTLRRADGTPARSDTMTARSSHAYKPGGLLDVKLTGEHGGFEVTVPANTSYDLSAFQINESANHIAQRDGTADIYAIDRRNDTSAVTMGNVSLPVGHVVNVQVVDASGDPVAGADVNVSHFDPASGARATLRTVTTDSDGLMVADAFDPAGYHRSDVPGLELNGTVSIEVKPPADRGFVERTYVRNLTVNSRENITMVLQPVDTSINLSEAEGAPGENVTVHLWANASEVASYQANFTFNDSVARVVSVEGVDFTDPTANVRNDQGYVFLSQAEPVGQDDPLLAAITFNVTATNGSTALDFNEADTLIANETGAEIQLGTFNDGRITVQQCSRGDANGDGSVTSGDATLVLRTVVGLTDPESLTDCADANNDGSLTSGDATIILRIVVGLAD